MIRPYSDKDKDDIIKILTNGLELDMDYINKDFIKSKAIVYDDGKIKGFILLTPRNFITKSWNIDVYVNPNDRKKGIGTMLYNEGLKFLYENKANTISTKYVNNKSLTYDFYKNAGFKRWFSYYEMKYEGDLKEESNIEFINYEDKYYDKYVKLISEGFYELRVENDIQPYICYIPSKEDRKDILEDRENIYISIDSQDEIISTVLIDDGYIDELVVNSRYVGRGIGKETTKFAINNCINKKIKNICLDVVTWNTKAINIYKSLGFKEIQKIEVARQFLDKELL